MVNVRQLLAQKLFGVHSVPSRTQVELQRVYTGLGAEGILRTRLSGS